MDGTILGQGTFTSTGVATTIAIPSGCDFLRIKNFTRADNAATGGFDFYWQYLMGTTGTVLINTAGTVTSDQTAANAFVVYNPAQNPVGAPIAITGSTNAVRPVITSGTLPAVNDIVRISGSEQTDVNGIDFVVGASGGGTFTLMTATNPLATAPGVAGTTGSWRPIKFNPLFYPRRRTVVNITQDSTGTVSTSIPHGFTVGQAVRFSIPVQSGMVQLNSNQDNNFQTFTVVSVTDAYNFTIGSTAGNTAFTWPTAVQVANGSQFPEVVPVGENTAAALNAGADILGDATVNTGFLGMTLAAGANLPAGQNNDVIYWVAGKSMYGGQ